MVRKTKPTNELRMRIKMLDIEIKSYYHGLIKKKIRKDILPGNTQSLWNAVKIAKVTCVKVCKLLFTVLIL